MFDYKKLWTRQKSTLLDLYQLRNELGFRLSNASQDDDINVADLFTRYQDIWERDGSEWRNIIHTQSKIDNSMPSQSSSNLLSN